MVKISELEIYDSANFLETQEECARFLTGALEDGDPYVIRKALQAVARKTGMAKVAKAADLDRKSLYRSLGEKGNPEFATVLRLMKAMGMSLAAVPIPTADPTIS